MCANVVKVTRIQIKFHNPGTFVWRSHLYSLQESTEPLMRVFNVRDALADEAIATEECVDDCDDDCEDDSEEDTEKADKSERLREPPQADDESAQPQGPNRRYPPSNIQNPVQQQEDEPQQEETQQEVPPHHLHHKYVYHYHGERRLRRRKQIIV